MTPSALAPQTIRQLPEELASRIAAGEVVERPASVVKELVENALDAGAKRVEVTVAGGGLELIRVSDDGYGIDPEQLELAFYRHATSKLAGDSSLFAITTLGFRGEALPSIAAVAEVELVSRPHELDAGAAVHWRFGEFVRKGARSGRPGTSVAVRRLFARQQPRLKFLRSRAHEYQQIGAVIDHYALARPDVAFRLEVDGRNALSTDGAGDLRRVMAAVHGAEVARQLLEVAGESSGVVVRGCIAPPSINRSTRGGLSLFVNGRWIQNRRLLFALDDAFQGLLPRGRHPIAAVFIDLPHEEVDVNAHPTKAEVRFRDEGVIFGALQRALRATLSEFAPAASMASPFADTWEPPLDGSAPSIDLLSQPPIQSELVTGGEPGAASPISPARRRLPLLRVLGQMGGTYIVCEGPDGMYLLDQHAAHERVLFDDLVDGAGNSQSLLEPVAVDLSPARNSALEESRAELDAAGFAVEPLDDGHLLRALPAGLAARSDPAGALAEFLDALVASEAAGERSWRIRATIACHSAVRAGMTMADKEMRMLIELLERSAEPLACPHGRPTLVHLPVDVLDRQFGRTWRPS